MKALRSLFLASLVLGSTGCDILGLDGAVDIRVRNASSLTFDEGVLYVHMDSILFPGLEPGQATPYQEVDRGYRIATTQVVTGPDTARLQVIDFVGEEPLDPGRYTFVLSFFEGNPTSLVQELKKDR
jgi:hypothetical protein